MRFGMSTTAVHLTAVRELYRRGDFEASHKYLLEHHISFQKEQFEDIRQKIIIEWLKK